MRGLRAFGKNELRSVSAGRKNNFYRMGIAFFLVVLLQAFSDPMRLDPHNRVDPWIEVGPPSERLDSDVGLCGDLGGILEVPLANIPQQAGGMRGHSEDAGIEDCFEFLPFGYETFTPCCANDSPIASCIIYHPASR
jgi:hypothetical protein